MVEGVPLEGQHIPPLPSLEIFYFYFFIFYFLKKEASLTSLRERLARTTTMIYAGAFMDGESDSKCEREPRGVQIYEKTQQIITTCWGSFN